MEAVFKEMKLLRQGVNIILFDILTNLYSHNSDTGYCTIEDRKKIEKLHSVYHHLGGNGTVDILMEKLQELPTEPTTKIERVKYAKDTKRN